MLDAYSSGPGVPLPYPQPGLISTAADEDSVVATRFILLDLTAVAPVDDDMPLAHACKALSEQARSMVDTLILTRLFLRGLADQFPSEGDR